MCTENSGTSKGVDQQLYTGKMGATQNRGAANFRSQESPPAVPYSVSNPIREDVSFDKLPVATEDTTTEESGVKVDPDGKRYILVNGEWIETSSKRDKKDDEIEVPATLSKVSRKMYNPLTREDQEYDAFNPMEPMSFSARKR